MINVDFILKATAGKPQNINYGINTSQISIDSRRIKSEEIFIALKGENFDGHNFVSEAFNKGASLAIVEEIPSNCDDKPLIVVESTELALKELAKSWRDSFDGLKVAAITGSNGKTTTKEMTYSILSVKNNVLKNSGNFNNHIGLPLTLLKLKNSHELCVIELGMNDFGEIKELARIANPDVGAITNIGRAHLEKLGSIEGVAKAKGELVENFSIDNTFCVNADDPFVMQIAEKASSKKIFYGLHSKESFIKIENIDQNDFESITFDINICGNTASTRIRGIGVHNVLNALCASTISYALGCTMEEIQAGLERYTPSQMRLEMIESPYGFKIINDAYNANPDSMLMGIRELSRHKEQNRVFAVLGDMLELGESSKNQHENIGKELSESNIDFVITVGEQARYISSALNVGSKGRHVKNHEEASKLLLEIAKPGDVVLIKGSRGMKMENVIQNLYKVS